MPDFDSFSPFAPGRTLRLLTCAAFFFIIGHPLLWSQTPDAARRPMQFADLMKMRRLGDTAVSPDGKWVLFAVTDASLDRNTRTSHLWIVPTTGASAETEKPVTASTAGESGGRFSPDGKQVLFESSRDGDSQIYLANFDSTTGDVGDARALTSISTGADAAIWSPDGQNILFTSAVYPECSSATQTPAQQDACNKQRDTDQANSKVKAQLFTHLLERHWNSFTGDKRSHLFLVPAAGGAPRDLTPGDPHDVPPFSLGGPQPYAFSPDGKEIAFEENLDPEPAISTNADIFTLQLDDPVAKPIKVSTSPGGDFSPAYSPDGKYIAWRSQVRNGYESDRFRLTLYDRQTKLTRELMPAFDRWIDEFAWSSDSSAIYFVSGDHGEAPVYRLDLKQYRQQVVSRAGEFSDLHIVTSADGTSSVIASRMTVQRPSEIVSLSLSGELDDAEPGKPGVHLRLLTDLNTHLLAQLDLPEMQRFWFRGALGTRVQGFLIKPPGFDPAKKYPLKFLIHGGPEGAWGDAWSYRWNPELFAADGYVVVMVNPRGSTGYGQKFTEEIGGDWGGKPYIDLMRGLDSAEQQFPFIDKTRECALGASYGGYMADWILGHTDRFACIVTHDGMFNTESAYGTTDELWFNEWEFKGTPWTNRLMYRRWSPMLSVAKMKTPTLIVHSQLDYRLDVSEGYQLFTTLQRMHVPSQMLYFPDEGHWVLKPQNSELWYKTVNSWCDKWTKTNQP